ncbi:polysaccharide pyruvyl transferase family protein [Gracilibacillus phocaeensis]|uniref:polysaccharide pyruvyl transferase family protein n=1 Tax=Gracilibacillus phocaeensis TaxID=2042304 RepID=UPI00102FDAFA|nr:polysaccharide pyruvyl transferase family protein [Gracilibacillus phocaeensis]
MRKVLYIGWIGYHNLGDDLLWHAFQTLQEKYLAPEKMTVVPAFPTVNINQLEPYDTIVLGGGSLIAPSYISVLYKAVKQGKNIIIWGSGIDRITETQLDQLRKGENIPSISRFRGEEVPMLKEVLHAATFAGVRGPYTKKVLETLTGIETIPVIGDPGVLLQVENPKKLHSKTIGINWGTTNNQLYGGNEKALEDQLVLVSQQLIAAGYQIFIYAVWDQDFAACRRLQKKIDREDAVFFEKKRYSEQELMSELSGCQLTINFKLHPNLLSFAAGTPAIALGYRFKVFDMYASFGLENLVLSTANANIAQDLIPLVTKVTQRRETYIKTYQDKQAYYQPKIEQVFKEKMI